MLELNMVNILRHLPDRRFFKIYTFLSTPYLAMNFMTPDGSDTLNISDVPNPPDIPDVPHDPNMPHSIESPIPTNMDEIIFLITFAGICAFVYIIGFAVCAYFSSPEKPVSEFQNLPHLPEVPEVPQLPWEQLRLKLINEFLSEHPDTISRETVERYIDVLHHFVIFVGEKSIKGYINFQDYWTHWVNGAMLKDGLRFEVQIQALQKQLGLYKTDAVTNVVNAPVTEPFFKVPTVYDIQQLIFWHTGWVLLALVVLGFLVFFVYTWYDMKRSERGD